MLLLRDGLLVTRHTLGSSIYLSVYLIWYIIVILLYALTKQGYVLIYQGKFLFYGGLMECTVCEFAEHTLSFLSRALVRS